MATILYWLLFIAVASVAVALIKVVSDSGLFKEWEIATFTISITIVGSALLILFDKSLK